MIIDETTEIDEDQSKFDPISNLQEVLMLSGGLSSTDQVFFDKNKDKNSWEEIDSFRESLFTKVGQSLQNMGTDKQEVEYIIQGAISAYRMLTESDTHFSVNSYLEM
jgi:hypothetical protein